MSYHIFIIIFFIRINVNCYNVPIPDKIVIVGDYNVIDFVRNFYKEVILKYNVPNFKMVVWNPSSYAVYEKYGIPVEYSPIEMNDNVASTFQYTEQYTKKINDRFKILLEYLRQNLTILCFDSDLYFFENPLNLLNHIDPKNDITYATDFIEGNHTELNCGLMYIKPTKASIRLFERVLEITKIGQRDFDFMDQGITNLIISAKRINNLKYGVFSLLTFAIGFFYFRYFKHFVDDVTNSKTIGFHNNCIEGGIAKKYRFKELGLWKIDDNEYYSSKTRKYIRYKYSLNVKEVNPVDAITFLAYMGKILNRTIILPRFIVYEDNKYVFRTFLHIFNINDFESVYEEDGYRENVFLQSPLVPEEVKENDTSICSTNEKDLLVIKSSVISLECYEDKFNLRSKEKFVYNNS